MSAPAPSQPSPAVIESVEALIVGTEPRDVLLVGDAAAALEPLLDARGVDVATADAPVDGRSWHVVVVLGLADPDGATQLRGIGRVLDDDSSVVTSVPASLTADGFRALAEGAGLLVEDLRSDAEGQTLVGRCVPHRAAAQVASARRRISEVVAERDALRDQLAASEDARRRQVNQLEARVADLRDEVATHETTVAGTTELLAEARQQAKRGQRQRDRARAERDELRRTVEALQSRRVIKVANRIGRLVRRLR